MSDGGLMASNKQTGAFFRTDRRIHFLNVTDTIYIYTYIEDVSKTFSNEIHCGFEESAANMCLC
jgi:hypothetical protein